MKFENSTVKVFGAFALVILVVLGFIVLDNWHGKEASEPEGVSEPQPVAVQENGSDETAQPIPQEGPVVAAAPQKDRSKGSAPRVIGSERSIQLSRLLDDDASHADALALALELAEKGTDHEKVDALSALEWIGGKEAVLASIKLKGAGDAVGERAGQVLNHLIQESLVTDEPLLDAESWKALFNGLYDDSEIQSYMVLLSGYSLEDSFPILLELAESGREKVADVAKEYLSSVAFGREFKDVEDAKTWYKQYQELQAKKAKEALREAAE